MHRLEYSLILFLFRYQRVSTKGGCWALAKVCALVSFLCHTTQGEGWEFSCYMV